MLGRRIVLSVLLLLPGVLLIALALAPLRDGVSTDSVIPVQKYLILQSPLPKALYVRAFPALASAHPDDGTAKIFAVEAAIAAGASPASQTQLLIAGLEDAPANPRGWMFLSDALASANPDRAAEALGQSFTLAPYDYWIAGDRAQRAAKLWPRLNSYDRASALRQVILLWEEPLLRPQIADLLQTPEGLALLTRAFAGRPDELRELNRWVGAQLRRYQQEF